jgi:hypothetical protein
VLHYVLQIKAFRQGRRPARPICRTSWIYPPNCPTVSCPMKYLTELRQALSRHQWAVPVFLLACWP